MLREDSKGKKSMIMNVKHVKLIEGNKRECSKCHKILPLVSEYFAKAVTGTFGYCSCCKQCQEHDRRMKGMKPVKKIEYRTIDGVLRKQCSKCGVWTKQCDYSKDHRHSDGLQSSCRKCNVDCGIDHRRKLGMQKQKYVDVIYIDNIPHRECTRCKRVLPFNHFSDSTISNQTRTGKASFCKSCHTENEMRLRRCAKIFCKKNPPKKSVISVTCSTCGNIFGLQDIVSSAIASFFSVIISPSAILSFQSLYIVLHKPLSPQLYVPTQSRAE